MSKKKVEEVEVVVEPVIETSNEKEELLALYNRLKELKVDRISNLENLIARCK